VSVVPCAGIMPRALMMVCSTNRSLAGRCEESSFRKDFSDLALLVATRNMRSGTGCSRFRKHAVRSIVGNSALARHQFLDWLGTIDAQSHAS
jgi:hypothetical protein